jgi:hypothetical protein
MMVYPCTASGRARGNDFSTSVSEVLTTSSERCPESRSNASREPMICAFTEHPSETGSTVLGSVGMPMGPAFAKHTHSSETGNTVLGSVEVWARLASPVFFCLCAEEGGAGPARLCAPSCQATGVARTVRWRATSAGGVDWLTGSQHGTAR